jgi:hypothetical protein
VPWKARPARADPDVTDYALNQLALPACPVLHAAVVLWVNVQPASGVKGRSCAASHAIGCAARTRAPSHGIGDGQEDGSGWVRADLARPFWCMVGMNL